MNYLLLAIKRCELKIPKYVLFKILYYAGLQFHHGLEPVKNCSIKKLFKGAIAAWNTVLIRYIFAQEEKKYLRCSKKLIKACKFNKTEIAEIMIKNHVGIHGEAIYYIYKHGNTVLIKLLSRSTSHSFLGACSGGHTALIKELLVEFNDSRDTLSTGLFILCKKHPNNEFIFNLYSDFESGIYGACEGNNNELALKLMEKHKFSKTQAFSFACKGNNKFIIDKFITEVENFDSALDFCCERGDLELIKRILNEGQRPLGGYSIKVSSNIEAFKLIVPYLRRPEKFASRLDFDDDFEILKLILEHHDGIYTDMIYETARKQGGIKTASEN